MSNTPSKAEIEKLAAEHLKAFSQFPMGGQVWFEGEVEFARAILAKWGTQPQAGAVPLTDEQIVGVMHSIPINAAPSYHIAFARAIEQAHGLTSSRP